MKFKLPAGFDESHELVVAHAEQFGVSLDSIRALDAREMRVTLIDARMNVHKPSNEELDFDALDPAIDWICRWTLHNQCLYPRRLFRTYTYLILE